MRRRRSRGSPWGRRPPSRGLPAWEARPPAKPPRSRKGLSTPRSSRSPPATPRWNRPSPECRPGRGSLDALVTGAWLAAHFRDRDLRVVDVRWYLDPARRGRDAYEAGHIPGAVFLDMDVDLSAPGGGRGRPPGRHPWPPEPQVARVMGAAGIGASTRVLAYDDQSGAGAAPPWYLPPPHGHPQAAGRDGGPGKWRRQAAGTRPAP